MHHRDWATPRMRDVCSYLCWKFCHRQGLTRVIQGDTAFQTMRRRTNTGDVGRARLRRYEKKARAHNTLPLVPLWHFPAPPIRLFPPYRSFIIHIFFITLPLPNIRPFLPLLSLFHPHFTRRNVFSIYFTFLSPTYFPTEAFSASRTQILSCLLLMGDDGRCIINGRSRNTRNSSKSNVSSSSRNNSDNGSSGSLIIVTKV